MTVDVAFVEDAVAGAAGTVEVAAADVEVDAGVAGVDVLVGTAGVDVEDVNGVEVADVARSTSVSTKTAVLAAWYSLSVTAPS